MKIDRALNIVVPIDTDDGRLYVHSTPISHSLFEEHFLVLSKAYATIFTGGLGVMSGPRVAHLMLRKYAQELGVEREVNFGLINEIVRLSNVSVPTENGYKSMPLQSVIDGKKLDEKSLSEVLGALVFFTLVSVINTREQASGILEVSAGLWGAQISSLDSTAFTHSLQTLTEVENTGEPVKPSSVPS